MNPNPSMVGTEQQRSSGHAQFSMMVALTIRSLVWPFHPCLAADNAVPCAPVVCNFLKEKEQVDTSAAVPHRIAFPCSGHEIFCAEAEVLDVAVC